MSAVKTVYLADDDEDDRMLIREALEQVISGVRVIEVEDGTSLLELLHQSRSSDPFVIIMDMNMPRMNGLETLKEIRTMYSAADAPVVMMSTTLNNELTIRAYDENINVFLSKPITEQEFSHMSRAVDLCFLQRDPDPLRWTTAGVYYAQDVVFIHENVGYEKTVRYILRKSMPHANITELFSLAEALCFFDSIPFTAPDRPNMIIFLANIDQTGQSMQLKDLKRLLVQHKLTSSTFIVCDQRPEKSKTMHQPVQRSQSFSAAG